MNDRTEPSSDTPSEDPPATLEEALRRIDELQGQIAENDERGIRLATFFLDENLTKGTPAQLLEKIASMLQDLMLRYGFSPEGGAYWVSMTGQRFRLPPGPIVGAADETAIALASKADGGVPAHVVEASDGRPFLVVPLLVVSEPESPYGWLGIELHEPTMPSDLAISMVLAITGWIWQNLDRASSIAEARGETQIARIAAKAQILLARPHELDDALRAIAELMRESDDIVGVAAVSLGAGEHHTVAHWGQIDPETAARALRQEASDGGGELFGDFRHEVMPVLVDGAQEAAFVIVGATGSSALSDELLRTMAGAVGGAVARHRASRTIEILRRSATRQLIEAQERERSVIAADVHDGVLQQLGATAIRLELAQAQVERGDFGSARTIIEDGAKEIRACARELRSLLMELRPQVLDDNGLSAALKELGRNVEGVDIEIETEVPDDLGNEYSITIFRIVQEALNNIQKHAQADHGRVDVHMDDGAVEIEISDDGVGYEAAVSGPSAEGSHLGLLGMRERADMLGGTFSIEGRSGSGTRIVAVLPLKRDAFDGDTGANGRPEPSGRDTENADGAASR